MTPAPLLQPLRRVRAGVLDVAFHESGPAGEQRLAAQPVISVPSVTFDGADDGVRGPADSSAHAHQFSGRRSHRIVPGVGHNLPQEAPRPFADAVLELADLPRS
jgi:pimeloyl-ACP methyl ester carboxylesterase